MQEDFRILQPKSRCPHFRTHSEKNVLICSFYTVTPIFTISEHKIIEGRPLEKDGSQCFLW